MPAILILHGPNLNLLGKRQPEIYGKEGFESVLSALRETFPHVELTYYQSNHEGDLIDAIQQAEGEKDAIVINAGGFSHTSVAVADAVASVQIPVYGVHISNIYQREKERHIDLLSKYCKGTIVGLGTLGYRFAIDAALHNLSTE
jgi:3-dehydroquinate dehydratase-2